MTIKTSSGLRNGMLVSDSFKGLMDGGVINIYSGAVPATADAALGAAVLLCTVSNDASGDGVTFESAASDGTLVKTAAEIWRGVNVASGAASFYRLVTPGDDGAQSTTQPRVQGNVAIAGSDMNLSSVNLTAGADQTIDFFSWALPTA